MILHLFTTTAFLLPFVLPNELNRQTREISFNTAKQVSLNLIPPDNDGYHQEQKEIYRCKGTADIGYQYEPPRIQLVEEPNNIGYKVAGPKIIYIDCTTTTRKPNTEKILKYHFEMSFTNYPWKYTTEKYKPVIYRSTPGRKYLPEGSTTARPFFTTSTSTYPVQFSTSRTTATSIGVGSLTGFTKLTPSSTRRPFFSSTKFSTPVTSRTQAQSFSTSRPTFSGFSYTTLIPFKTSSAKTTRPFEFTTRSTTQGSTDKPFFSTTTFKPRSSTSGSGYLPPEESVSF